MTAAARAKAERCFALARSSTFEGEIASAISRGTAIAEAAGLSLDLFDIPGRVRQRSTKFYPGFHEYAAQSTQSNTVGGLGASSGFDVEEMMNAIRTMQESAIRAESEARAKRAAKESALSEFDRACSFLASKQKPVTRVSDARDGSPRWRIKSVTIIDFSRDEVIAIARGNGFK